MSSKPIRVGISGTNEFDPLDIYYTHSKIRPFFSGCGKRIVDTIEEIESGKISVHDIPQVSVILDDHGNVYCLNNRRLYVFKYIRNLGLLENNKITARIKKGIPRELAKYTPEKCSKKGTIIREKAALVLEKNEKESEESSCPSVMEGNLDSELSTNISSDNVDLSEQLKPNGETSVESSASMKNNKKKLQMQIEETDEERYARQARRIAEAKERYEVQAAERLKRKKEKEALLQSNVQSSDTAMGGDDDEEVSQDIFICDLCSKEFKSVEQVEQHFQSKAHRKLVQLEFKKKKEREKKAAKRERVRQKKLKKSMTDDLDDSSLTTLTNPAQLTEELTNITLEKQKTDDAVRKADAVTYEDKIESSKESGESDSDSDDEELMLLQMASNVKKAQLGLPGMESESD